MGRECLGFKQRCQALVLEIAVSDKVPKLGSYTLCETSHYVRG